MLSLHPWLTSVALIAVLVSAFVGAAVLAVVEVSLLRVRVSRVRVDAAQGDRRSQDLLLLLEELPLVMNTVLFIVLLCQVSVAATSGYLAQQWAGGPWVTVVSILVSLLLFVYAESLPKTMAVRAPHERALRAARSLRFLVRLWRPVVAALVAFAGLHAPEQATAVDVVSERELRLLARQAAQAGEIAASDAQLVDRSFIFGDQRVADVMVDRSDIVAVSASDPIDVTMQVAVAAGHRRLPVIDQTLDNVVGVVRLRDLVAARSQYDSASAQVMKPPLFCRADESIAVLMERMRNSSTWLAIVRDPTGITVGLATVEDIVAELMGEIEEGPVVDPFDERQVDGLSGLP